MKTSYIAAFSKQGTITKQQARSENSDSFFLFAIEDLKVRPSAILLGSRLSTDWTPNQNEEPINSFFDVLKSKRQGTLRKSNPSTSGFRGL